MSSLPLLKHQLSTELGWFKQFSPLVVNTSGFNVSIEVNPKVGIGYEIIKPYVIDHHESPEVDAIHNIFKNWQLKAGTFYHLSANKGLTTENIKPSIKEVVKTYEDALDYVEAVTSKDLEMKELKEEVKDLKARVSRLEKLLENK